MRALFVVVLVLCALPASAADRILPSPRVSDGNVLLGSDLNIGNFVNGKFTVPISSLPNLFITPGMSTADINAVIASAPAGSTIIASPGVLLVNQTQSGRFDGGNPTGACFGEPYGIIVQNKTDVTIDFSNAKLLNQGTDVANYYHTLCLDGNSRVTVKNGISDYSRLPYTQGVVTAANLTPGAQSLAFNVDDASFIPSFTTVQRIEKFSADPETFGNYLGTVHNNEPATLNFPISCSGTTCTVTNTNTTQQMSSVAVGDRILAEGRIYDGDAVRLIRNKGVLFDNFRGWSAPGMGFRAFGWASGTIAQQDIIFQNNSGVEAPPGRAQSVNADCVHMQGVRGKFTFTGGVLEGCRDDAINVYDFHSKVTSRSGNTLGLTSVRGWAPGDTLRYLAPNGAVRGFSRLISMASSGGPFDTGSIQVETPPTDVAVGDYIESVTGGADMLVATSRIGRSRGHGILANARRVLIADNFLHDMQKVGAINIRMISGGFDQAVYPDAIKITGNQIDKVNLPSRGSTAGALDTGAIAIEVLGENNVETPGCQLQNVHIEDNSITNTGGPAITATGVCTGRIAGNYIANWGLFPGNRFGPHVYPANVGIALGYGSTSLKIGPNTFVGTTGPYVAGVTAASKSAIGYQNQQQAFTDTAFWDGAGTKNYSALQGQTGLYIQAGTPGASYTAGLTIALPANPSDFDEFEIKTGFSVPAANLTVTSDRTIGAAYTTNTGLSAATPARWLYIAFYNSWFRIN
jgi:hypothetical protein